MHFLFSGTFQVSLVATSTDDCLKDVDKARRHLRALISSKQCAPILLRLAWHDDAKTKTGGPNGSIRNEKEYRHSANNEDVKAKHPKITYADLYQASYKFAFRFVGFEIEDAIKKKLAGVVAVEVTGGPTIDFVPGREDSLDSPEEDRLPDAREGVRHLKNVFYWTGLSDEDIIALSGLAHTGTASEFGEEHIQIEQVLKAPGQRSPSSLTTHTLVELLKGERKGLLNLPTDKALLEVPVFKQSVELYAKVAILQCIVLPVEGRYQYIGDITDTTFHD